MKAPRAFTSLLAPDIERYLTVKQALGREYDGVRRVLAHLDHFLTTRGDDLTPDTFAGWSLTLQHLASGTRRHRMQVVRNLCRYKRRRVPAAFIPDERLFPPDHQVVRPHLFTEAEVLRLVSLVKALPPAPSSPLRRENLHLAIVILYTTGLRLGELVRLTLSDYDPCSQPLLATYMGHVSIVSTEYYLQFVEPLATFASERFARHCGALVTAPAARGGAR
jgi:integrase/recombinase XerD